MQARVSHQAARSHRAAAERIYKALGRREKRHGQPGDIVIMDNLAAHKAAGIREAIEAQSAGLRYCRLIPPTSTRSSRPSPSSRPSCARPPSAVDGLWTKIGRLLDLFPPAECANYLANSDIARVKMLL